MDKRIYLKKIALMVFAMVALVACNKNDDDVLNSNAEITNFEINNIKGVIDDATIEVVLPSGTDLKNLTANVAISERAAINPNPETPMDYSNPVEFKVTSENGLTQKTYTIKVVLEKVMPSAENPYPEGIFLLKSISVDDDGYQLNFKHTSGNVSAQVFQKANNGQKIKGYAITDIIPHEKGYLIFSNRTDNTGGQLQFTDLKFKVIKETRLEKCNSVSGRYAKIGNKVYYSNITLLAEYNQPDNRTYIVDVETQTVQRLDQQQILRFFVTSSDELYYTDIIKGLYKVSDLNTLAGIEVEDFEDYSSSFTLDTHDRLWSLSRTRDPGNFGEANQLSLGRFDYKLNLVCYDINSDKKIEGVSLEDMNRHSSLFVKNGDVYIITNQNEHLPDAKKELQKLEVNGNTVTLTPVLDIPRPNTIQSGRITSDASVFDFPNNNVIVFGSGDKKSAENVSGTYYYNLDIGSGTVSDKTLESMRPFYRKAL